nr:hypothetical protein CFP56_19465 [Quercus suber]
MFLGWRSHGRDHLVNTRFSSMIAHGYCRCTDPSASRSSGGSCKGSPTPTFDTTLETSNRNHRIVLSITLLYKLPFIRWPEKAMIASLHPCEASLVVFNFRWPDTAGLSALMKMIRKVGTLSAHCWKCVARAVDGDVLLVVVAGVAGDHGALARI